MDKIDIAILNELQKNARISNRQLAEKVFLSPSAALERVRRLKRSGIIRDFKARLDCRKLGYDLAVFVEVRLEKNIYSEKVLPVLKKCPEILEIYDVSGINDYLLKVVASGSDELRDLLAAIGKLPGVVSTQTTMILDTCKQELAPVLHQKDQKQTGNGL